MTHSPEPWTQKPFECNCGKMQGTKVVDANGEPVNLQEHLDRILACVNACKDVPTDVLENVRFLNPAADPMDSDYAKGFMDGAGQAIKKLAEGQS